MSRDHYVSKVHIKLFMDNDELYYCDKLNNFNIRKAHSPTSIFYHHNLNATIDEDGLYDLTSVEKSLNQNFENDLLYHYNRLVNCINTDEENGLLESIKYLMQIGLVGRFRNPHHGQESRQSFFDGLREVIQDSTEEQKENLNKMEASGFWPRSDFKELSDSIEETMGEVIYSVFLAPDNENFILPDCTSVVMRTKCDDEMINGEVYKNLAEPITTVIFPISNKIVLVGQSKRICPIESHSASVLDAGVVYEYNKMFFTESYEKVACGNEEYLKKFIAEYSNETKPLV